MNSRALRFALVVVLIALASPAAQAAEKASEQVSPFFGSFGHGIPIEVPPFRGLEPHLALGYTSEGRDGLVGVGWSLGGFSTIERTNAGGGTPRWDGSDVFRLDGAKMLACQAGVVSPGCAAGGTHATENENFKRIKLDAASNTWTVWEKSGVRSVYTSLMSAAQGTYRWGLSQVIDTLGNTVNYSWQCTTDCYPSTVTYGPYAVWLAREARPDVLTYARGADLGRTTERLLSVIVWMPGVGHIRGYKLTYTTSPQTGRSLLASVQQFGKDLVHTNGLITGGTSLPPHTFTYTTDAAGRTFVSQGSQPPTPGGTTEPVEWSELVKTEAVDPTNTLKKIDGVNGDYDARGSSTRALSSGNGYMEALALGGYPKRWGLSRKVKDFAPAEIDYAFSEQGGSPGPVVVYAYEKSTSYGPWNANYGDVLRIEVNNGAVQWKKNGQLLRERPAGSKVGYPLAAVATLTRKQDVVSSVMISGSLQNVAGWCWGEQLLTGDFNGDGRTDQACYTNQTQQMRVRLSTGAGFADPVVWRTGYDYSRALTGDFNNDGKTDLAAFSPYNADFLVTLSTGAAFADAVNWGSAAVTDPATGYHYNCKTAYVALGAGDFDGDGRLDVSCRQNWDSSTTPPPNVAQSPIIIGRSTGSSFQFSYWGNLGCAPPADQQTSAIDFDGDGKDDWACIGNGHLQVYVSTGSTFVYPSFGELGQTFCGAHYVLGDFNGDGRTDAHCVDNGKIALSTGRSFVEQGTYGTWCPFVPGETDPTTQVFAADVDGDGASEIVCNNAVGAVNDIQVRDWSDASGLGAAETWKTSWCEGQLRGGDFDGDAKMDLLCDKLATPVAFGGTSGQSRDLLAGYQNPLGGTVSVTYTATTAFPSTNNPSPRYAVTGITTNDGRGGVSTTSYTYSGGFMDRLERRYLGFRYARVTKPCLPGEAACPYNETWFLQDPKVGPLLERTEAHAGGGALLAKSEQEYSALPAAAPYFRLPTGSWSYAYGTGGESKRTYTTYAYNSYGNPTQVTEHGDYDVAGDERTAVTQYAANTTAYIVSRPAAEELREGAGPAGTLVRRTAYGYDYQDPGTPPMAGRLTRSSKWLDTVGAYEDTTMTYDAWGNVQTVSYPSSAPVSVTMDSAYHLRPAEVRNSLNEAQTAQWDWICSAPATTTDANGLSTTVSYDALCRVQTRSGPLGTFENYTYLNLGSPTQQRTRAESPSPSPGDGTGDYFKQDYFDGFGWSYRSESKGPSLAETIVSEKGKNARGGLAWQKQPYYAGAASSPVTSYGYDALDRVVTTVLPDNHQIQVAYGAWQQTATDPLGRTATTYLDAFGRTRRTEQEDDQGRAVASELTYNARGERVGMTDPAGNEWSWTYDSLGRLLQRADPDSGTWSWAYNTINRTTTQTDAKGQITETQTDATGRTIRKTTYGPGGTNVTFSYGEQRTGYFNTGRLTTMTDGHGTEQYDYDSLGRQVRQSRVLGGVTYTLQRRYSTSGHLTGITWPDGDAFGTPAAPITYDAAGRMKTVPGFVTNATYDALGRPKWRYQANGTTTFWDFDERGALRRIQTTSTGEPGGLIQDLQYTPDVLGRVQSVSSPFPYESWSYGYDLLGRLTTATSLYDPAQSQSFQYDIVGSKTWDSRIGAITYPLPGLTRPHAPTTVAGQAMTYDPNGNLLSGRGRTYEWNVENKPTVINGVSFAYAGDGTRLKKTAPGGTTLYPLGDDYEIRGAEVTKYLRLGGTVIGERVGTVNRWLHVDRLGSVQVVTDGTGVNILRSAYRPYGQKVADSTSYWEPLSYISERLDAETGLTYLHARYYDSELGVFVSADPADPAKGGVGPSRYSYSGGNPVSFSDPSGLQYPLSSCRPEQQGSGFECWNGHGWVSASVNEIDVYRNDTVTVTANAPPLIYLTEPESTIHPDPVDRMPHEPRVVDILRDFFTGEGENEIVIVGSTSDAANQMKGAPGVENARKEHRKKGCTGLSGYNASYGLYGGAAPGHSVRGPGNSYIYGQAGQFTTAGQAYPSLASLPGGLAGAPIVDPANIENPWREALGTYRVDMTPSSNGTTTVTVSDTMNFNSLALHMPEFLGTQSSWGKPSEFGNVTISISWTEPSGCAN